MKVLASLSKEYRWGINDPLADIATCMPDPMGDTIKRYIAPLTMARFLEFIAVLETRCSTETCLVSCNSALSNQR